MAIQLQADEQRGADRPIQMGPAKKTVTPPTEEEVEHARQAFSNIFPLDATELVAPHQAFCLEVVAAPSDDEDEQQQ